MDQKQPNILVLDDERFILVTVKSCLKGENFNVTTADDVQVALSEFKRGNFDVIVTDILMSSIDGFKFRDLIREYNKTVPIIFLTSLLDGIDNSLLSRITSDQHSYYLNKSFTKKALLEVLHKALSVSQAMDGVEALQKQIEADLDLASQVQRMMLPRWCVIERSYAASYLYEPRYKVSGDLFEMVDLGGDRCLCVIGDVAGHGIHAALCMAPLQVLIKRIVCESGGDKVSVHEILTQLNDFLCLHFSVRQYMTCLTAIWDFRQNRLVYQTAGHPDLICLDAAAGEIRELNPEQRGSLPLGMLPDNVYREQDNVEVDFTDESVFIAFTDGLLDIGSQSSPDSFLEKETLLSLIASLNRTETVVAIPCHLRNAITQIGYDFPSDDIFLFAIKKNDRKDKNTHIRYIGASIEEIEEAVLEVGNCIAEASGSENLGVRVELLLSEFLANIVKHGLERNQRLRDGIVLCLRLEDKQAWIEVMDHGKSWDYHAGLSGKDADTILDELNEQRAQSGRGVPIILRLAETITRHHYWGLNVTGFLVLDKKSE